MFAKIYRPGERAYVAYGRIINEALKVWQNSSFAKLAFLTRQFQQRQPGATNMIKDGSASRGTGTKMSVDSGGGVQVGINQECCE